VLHEARQADGCGNGFTPCCGSGGRRPLALVTPSTGIDRKADPGQSGRGPEGYLPVCRDLNDQPSSFLAIGLDV
jgi:hypothetical protein